MTTQLTSDDVAGMTVKDLRYELVERGADRSGRKAVLQSRLLSLLSTEDNISSDVTSAAAAAATTTASTSTISANSPTANNDEMDVDALLDTALNAMVTYTTTNKSSHSGASLADADNAAATEVPKETLADPMDLVEGLSSSLVSGLEGQGYFVSADGGEQYVLAQGADCTAKTLASKLAARAKDLEKAVAVPPVTTTQLKKAARRARKAQPETAGRKWFDLPATAITPEVMQDLKLLQLRGVLDRKKHFRSADSKALPKYFQIGHVIDGAADHYRDGGVVSKNKKHRLVDELLSDANFRRYNKKKFVDIARNDKTQARPLKRAGRHSKGRKGGHFHKVGGSSGGKASKKDKEAFGIF